MSGLESQDGGLRFDRVAVSLGDRQLLAVDRTIAPGEILTVMGPSGSGKSTLLAFAAGFLDPAFRAEGRVILNGADITALPPERRRLAADPLGVGHVRAPLVPWVRSTLASPTAYRWRSAKPVASGGAELMPHAKGAATQSPRSLGSLPIPVG